MSEVGILAVCKPEFGGTYQYTLSMIEALKLLPEHRYTLYTTASNHWYDELGLHTVRIPGPTSVLGGMLRKISNSKASSGLFLEVDKVIAPIYSTCLLASCRPFAFTLHDLQEEYYPQYLSYKQRAWRFVTNRLLARAATRIVCESRHVKADIERFLRVESKRVVVIPAPPVSLFRNQQVDAPHIRQVRERLSPPQQFLLYPAQFNPHKNHLRLVEAFAIIAPEYPSCHLLLTGEKRLEFTRVMRRVAELNLSSRVRHLGQIAVSDLVAVYKLATVVVIPTLFESISIPMYEAFSLGAPVCASNILALPEQAGEAAVLFDPMSVQDMAEKISTALGDSSLRARLIQRGTERIAAMSVEKYAARLRELLADLDQP